MYRSFHCLYYTLLLDVCQGLFCIFPAFIVAVEEVCKTNSEHNIQYNVECSVEEQRRAGNKMCNSATEENAVGNAPDSKPLFVPLARLVFLDL